MKNNTTSFIKSMYKTITIKKINYKLNSIQIIVKTWGAGVNLTNNNNKQDNRASGTDGGHPLSKSIQKVSQQIKTNTFPDPIQTFKQTIGKSGKEFSFKKIDIKKMATILNNMKSTFSTGPDDINMNTLKKLKTYTIPVLTKLFNSIIET